MSELEELIKFIDELESQSFTGWNDDSKNGYLTASFSIKKKAEIL
jgi:hypothetical protein